MTIRIKGDLGTEKEIFDILVQVARCDPLLTTGRYYADWKVNYAGSKPAAAAAAMLHDLCNNDWSIVIFGYPSDANCPDGTPIISIGGGTAVGRDIELYFDAYDAFYQGYIVDGAQGGTISIPPPVLMVHELSHVYHTVHTMAGKTQMDEEIQAIVVENAFRGQVGLPARKSDSHWGAPGVPSRPSPPFPYCIAPYQGWNCGCHIATAAIGAPSARSIVEFQRAVKEFETWTVGETPLLRPLLDAYQLFGPLVAADVRADPVLRADMLRDVVRPAHQLLRVVRVCLDTPPEDPRVAAEIAHAVTTYRVAVRHTVAPEAARGSFDRILAAAAAAGVDTRGPEWVLTGLATFLRLAADPPQTRRALAELGAWLAELPLPAAAPPETAAHLRRELAGWPGSNVPLRVVLGDSRPARFVGRETARNPG